MKKFKFILINQRKLRVPIQFILAMKMLVLLIMLGLQVSAGVFSQKLTLNVKNQPIAKGGKRSNT
jgi:hypothetical protein